MNHYHIPNCAAVFLPTLALVPFLLYSLAVLSTATVYSTRQTLPTFVSVRQWSKDFVSFLPEKPNRRVPGTLEHGDGVWQPQNQRIWGLSRSAWLRAGSERSRRDGGPWQNPNARVLYGECGAVERITVKEVLQAICGLWGPSIMCPGSRNLGKPR